MFKVLIPQPVAEEGTQYLLEQGYELCYVSDLDEDTLCGAVRDCDAILARTEKISERILRAGSQLKIVARHGVGYDNIDVEAATKLGIYVTTTPLANANSVAELALAFVMALGRKVPTFDRACKAGRFSIRNEVFGSELEGKTLGIVGAGRIGSLLARKASVGLGMDVRVYDPYITEDRLPEGVRLVREWEEIFTESDFISVHLPANADTLDKIGRSEFQLMKKSAYFINTSRGEVVNEAELAAALQRGEIAGAAVDVFREEPPADDHPLLKLEQVITTPHNAALTEESRRKMALHAAMSIVEVLSGGKPSWPVNQPKPAGGF